ncbi:unnamed protein product, partial [marine sediment metagenome]
MKHACRILDARLWHAAAKAKTALDVMQEYGVTFPNVLDDSD